MRLKSVEVEAFRAFASQQLIELDADVVLLVGRNGFGKTTIFDAISWCLFGLSSRWGGTRDFTRAEADYLTNAFRRLEQPRVRVALHSDEAEIVAERKGSDFMLMEGTEALSGSEGQARLLELLGFTGEADERLSSLQRRALDSFSRSFLLHQDLLSNFLTSENPRERFNAIAELFFITPIRDFYTHLVAERQRAREKGDSVASRLQVATAELNQTQRELAREQDRIRRVSGSSAESMEGLAAQLQTLLSQVRDVSSDFEEEEKPLDSLDKALVTLARFASRIEARLAELRSIENNMPLVVSWNRNAEELSRQIAETDTLAKDKKRSLASADSAAKKLREDLRTTENEIAEVEASIERLHAFLADAITFVESDVCPVCQRPTDRDHLLQELRARLEAASPEVREKTVRREAIRNELQAAERDLRRVSSDMRRLEQNKQALASRRTELQSEIEAVRTSLQEQLGRDIAYDQAEGVLKREASSAEQQLQEISALRHRAQDLRPAFEVIDSRERLQELNVDRERTSAVVQAARQDLKRYTRAAETLDALVSACRREERAIVEELITRFGQPIEESYRWLSVHPVFSELGFEFDEFAEAGELYFKVGGGDVFLNPSTTFSSAQANALALAVFFALNVGQNWSPLELAMIDDPVQNMDDVNVLGLIDLLRSGFENRQLIVSTALPHLARLFTDKFRPRKAGQRMIVHHFEALTEQGPVIEKELFEYTPVQRILPELERMSA